jgi:hypothetical protein
LENPSDIVALRQEIAQLSKQMTALQLALDELLRRNTQKHDEAKSVTKSEAAELWKVSVKTIERNMRELCALRVGRGIRIPLRAIKDYQHRSRIHGKAIK